MKCKNEFEFVVAVINDYLNTLPPSSKFALGEKLQTVCGTIEQTLNDLDDPVKTDVAPTK